MATTKSAAKKSTRPKARTAKSAAKEATQPKARAAKSAATEATSPRALTAKGAAKETTRTKAQTAKRAPTTSKALPRAKRATNATKTDGRKATVMSDAKVKAATGKTWAQWFAVLDRAKAMDMEHSAIALHLSDVQGVPPWWSQMVTVGYEQERGLRAVHEKPGGFEVGASKTLGVPIAELYRAWNDARRRAKWLAEPIEVRKATAEKSMRITWPDGTHVDAYFWDKGPTKSLIQVQHKKLANATVAQRTKALWKSRLDSLKEFLA